jgi:hypothetical protein
LRLWHRNLYCVWFQIEHLSFSPVTLGWLHNFYFLRSLQIIVWVYCCVQTILLLCKPPIFTTYKNIFNWTVVVKLGTLLQLVVIYLLSLLSVFDLASHWQSLNLTSLGWNYCIYFSMCLCLTVRLHISYLGKVVVSYIILISNKTLHYFSSMFLNCGLRLELSLVDNVLQHRFHLINA